MDDKNNTLNDSIEMAFRYGANRKVTPKTKGPSVAESLRIVEDLHAPIKQGEKEDPKALGNHAPIAN